jgi:hypothetical protein
VLNRERIWGFFLGASGSLLGFLEGDSTVPELDDPGMDLNPGLLDPSVDALSPVPPHLDKLGMFVVNWGPNMYFTLL